MAGITQVITLYEGDLPDKGSMTADEFDVAAEAWVDYQDGLATELNTWAEQANGLGATANDLAGALAVANFKGPWEYLSGAYDVPVCVLHNGRYWMMLVDVPEIAYSEPAVDNTDWAELSLDDMYWQNGTTAFVAFDTLAGDIYEEWVDTLTESQVAERVTNFTLNDDDEEVVTEELTRAGKTIQTETTFKSDGTISIITQEVEPS